MRTDEYFVLALRIIGAVMLIYGLRDLLDALLFTLGYFTLMDTTPKYYVVMGLCSLIAGLYFIRGAPQLAWFAFPGKVEEVERDDSSSDEQDT